MKPAIKVATCFLMNNYPIYLNIQGRKCVVAGAGQVARRKIRAFLDHGASVEVVSPEIDPIIRQWANENLLRIWQEPYTRRRLENAFLVVAATNNMEVNRKIAEDARERGILCNIVDQPQLSDFITPATGQKGSVSVSVSTGGKSPALARRVRDHLIHELPVSFVILNDILGALRRHKTIALDSSENNKKLWNRIIDSSLLKHIEVGDETQVEKELSALLGQDITLRELQITLAAEAEPNEHDMV